MAEIDGLTTTEYLALGPLNSDRPRPVWKITEDFAVSVVGEPPTRNQTAELLGPALVSLVGHSLVKVRLLADWPARWQEGVPVDSDRLVDDSRPDLWSRNCGCA